MIVWWFPAAEAPPVPVPVPVAVADPAVREKTDK